MEREICYRCQGNSCPYCDQGEVYVDTIDDREVVEGERRWEAEREDKLLNEDTDASK